MNKLVIIGVGGTGSILVEETKQTLEAMSDGGFIPEVKYLVIDTSDSNKRHADENGVTFHHISGKSINGEKLLGAGGLRREIAPDVKEGVIKFLNEESIMDDDPKRTFYVVVGSLGGGSGSTIGPIVTNLLLQQDRNVLVVVSGDDCSLLNANNTKRTLQLYNTAAVRQERALVMYYINENSDNKVDIDKEVFDNIKATNILMANAITNFAVFISGNNMQIDETEMAVFLNPVRLESEIGELPKGIYSYDYFVGEDDFSDKENIVSARILSVTKDKIPTLQCKNPRYGIPYSQELLAKFKADEIYPFVIINTTGQMAKVMDELDAKIEVLSTPISSNNIGEVSDEDDFL